MRHALTIILILIFCCDAFSAEVRLRDGSVVFGTIERLVDGEDLIIDTEYMDDVTIEWDAVEEIRETRVVEVELFNGQRLFGQVKVNKDGVLITGEDTSVMLRPEDVFAIAEVNQTFWDGLFVFTDLGMNIVRGNNDVSQLSFGAGVGYNGRNFETSIDGTTIINEQSEGQDLRRMTLSGTYTYRLRNNWQATGLMQFESDDQQGLDLRTVAGGALGRRLVNRRRWRFDLYGGLVVNSEEFEGQSRAESLEGLVAAIYRLRAAKGLDIDASLGVLPNLEQSDRVRVQFDASLSMDLIADLDFKVTVYDRYDSQPPAGNEKNDSGMTLGLSWEY